jgi:hypothetical protein
MESFKGTFKVLVIAMLASAALWLAFGIAARLGVIMTAILGVAGFSFCIWRFWKST